MCGYMNVCCDCCVVIDVCVVMDVMDSSVSSSAERVQRQAFP